MSKVPKPTPAPRKLLNKDEKKDDGKKREIDEKSQEIFERNVNIVSAFLPTVPYNYGDTVRKWIAKFFDPTIKTSFRNAYLAFLLFQMQNFKISDPFDKFPPKFLEDPQKLMSPAKWKTIMKEAEKELPERYMEKILPQQIANFRAEFKTPADFLSDQPTPSDNGIMVYGGCFSNHFVR